MFIIIGEVDPNSLSAVLPSLGQIGGIIAVVWYFLTHLKGMEADRKEETKAMFEQVARIDESNRTSVAGVTAGFQASVDAFRMEIRSVVDRLLTIAEKSAASEMALASRVAELATQVAGLSATTANLPNLIMSVRDCLDDLSKLIIPVPQRLEELVVRLEEVNCPAVKLSPPTVVKRPKPPA